MRVTDPRVSIDGLANELPEGLPIGLSEGDSLMIVAATGESTSSCGATGKPLSEPERPKEGYPSNQIPCGRAMAPI